MQLWQNKPQQNYAYVWGNILCYEETHHTKKKHIYYPDSKVHGANMGPIWARQDPGGPHFVPWICYLGTHETVDKALYI